MHIFKTLLLVPSLLGPFSAATNHADDILGTPDSRQGTWGMAGSYTHNYAFHPPAGYRVRVLRVYGNFQRWMRDPGLPGKCAGVLWGLRSNGDDSSPMEPASNNTMLYIQDATCGAPFRDSVDVKIENGLLAADNVLRSIVAVFLNETGEPIHLEPSFTVVYQFEQVDQ
jgi:hypothetical protein